MDKTLAVIIPAYNERKTIGKVVRAALKSRADRVIVVDDGSTDGTAAAALAAGAVVLKHGKNLGKGAALRTGVAAAGCVVIVFIDGDLASVTPGAINKLSAPVVSGEVDFAKAYFLPYKNHQNRSVFLYRPLLKQLFNAPDFVHPLSGQMCARKKFLQSVDFRNDYGVDVALLIDAVKKRLKIREVCLGKLNHRRRPQAEIEEITDQAIRAILEKAELA